MSLCVPALSQSLWRRLSSGPGVLSVGWGGVGGFAHCAASVKEGEITHFHIQIWTSYSCFLTEVNFDQWGIIIVRYYYSSIHSFSILLILIKAKCELGRIPDDCRPEVGYTLHWLLGNCRAHTDKQPFTFTFTFTPTDNWESSSKMATRSL